MSDWAGIDSIRVYFCQILHCIMALV